MLSSHLYSSCWPRAVNPRRRTPHPHPGGQIGVSTLWQITNASLKGFLWDATYPLPAKALAADRGWGLTHTSMRANPVAAPPSLSFVGTTPPGIHTLETRWKMPAPKDGRLHLALLSHTATVRVIAVATDRTKLSLVGAPPSTTNERNGALVRVAEKSFTREKAGTSIDVEVHDLAAGAQ